MTAIKIVCGIALMFSLASCTTEEKEMTENDVPADTAKKGVQPVDYMPMGTNESSAGTSKRERKFHIR
ncbi:MAG: hypothetical protein JWM14_2240 [Chitinophagaceae bacterium]|nr:hypothetical protein [Chitinophagaceae bacterium]